MKQIILVVSFISFIFVDSRFLQDAESCSNDKCKIADNCRCSNTLNPLGKSSPQLISLTFDEAIVPNSMDTYWKKLLYGRRNPDGSPISGTFFVPHEYTDYTQVHDLWMHGFEIGVHSITKNPLQSYWRNASVEQLVEEFDGQKRIISRYANIPMDQIKGVRTPQLQLNGDRSFLAYQASNLSYDSSWPAHVGSRYFPYTLDYKSTQKCDVSVRCPRESHKGLWVSPIVNLHGNGRECNILESCLIDGNTNDIVNWLLREIGFIRKSNRAPITLIIHSSWFVLTTNAFEALEMLLDHLESLDDVFFVSQQQVIDYMKNPVDFSNYRPTQQSRTSNCTKRVCPLRFKEEIRYMGSCTRCPHQYPWICDPYGLGNSC